MPTRPCRFCLSLQGDSVFADFDVDPRGCVVLARISFDGYGCCGVGPAARSLDVGASARLLEMIARKDLESGAVGEILAVYLWSLRDLVWEDALRHHQLFP